MAMPPARPSFAELLDWLEGRLPPEEAAAVAQRLEQAGEASQADLDWLRAFHAARQAVRLAAPPPNVRAELRRRFAAQAQATSPPGLFARLVAALSFDSRTQPATAGLRSTQGTDRRQLVYSAASVEVALDLQAMEDTPGGSPAERGLRLSGQVFAAEAAPAQVYAIQLLRQGGEVALTATDDLGEFALTNLPAGDYELVATASDHEVLLPAIRLEL